MSSSEFSAYFVHASRTRSKNSHELLWKLMNTREQTVTLSLSMWTLMNTCEHMYQIKILYYLVTILGITSEYELGIAGLPDSHQLLELSRKSKESSWVKIQRDEHWWTLMNIGDADGRVQTDRWTFMNFCEVSWTFMNNRFHVWSSHMNSHEQSWTVHELSHAHELLVVKVNFDFVHNGPSYFIDQCRCGNDGGNLNFIFMSSALDL